MPSGQNVTTGRIVYEYGQGPVEPHPQIQGDVPVPNPGLVQEDHIRSISIRQLNHGYVVEVGCQTLAIESASKLIALFSEYVLNPIATEHKYREGKLI